MFYGAVISFICSPVYHHGRSIGVVVTSVTVT